ncbi:lethal (2) SH0834 [Cochliomyia hominivorax]
MESLDTINNETIDSNEEELKAQEKLNQRREARRRKILDNAKNRLERLNGRTATNNTSPITPTSIDSHDVHNRHEHFNGPNLLDSVEFSDPEVEPDMIPQQFLQNDPTMIIGNLFSSLNGETTTTTAPQQKRHILLRARLHLVISALIACIFTIVLRESTTSSYSIFIPAGLCVIIDLLFFREQQPLNPIINLVITMCNIRLPSQTKNALHLFSIIQSLIVDLGVFIFCFCLFSFSLVSINYSFIDLIVIK